MANNQIKQPVKEVLIKSTEDLLNKEIELYREKAEEIINEISFLLGKEQQSFKDFLENLTIANSKKSSFTLLSGEEKLSTAETNQKLNNILQNALLKSQDDLLDKCTEGVMLIDKFLLELHGNTDFEYDVYYKTPKKEGGILKREKIKQEKIKEAFGFQKKGLDKIDSESKHHIQELQIGINKTKLIKNIINKNNSISSLEVNEVLLNEISSTFNETKSLAMERYSYLIMV